MPYEVELEDGMKIQVLSLNGHDWSVYHEKLVQAVWEAQRTTLKADYAIVLAVVKSNQWPSNIREQQCLTQWQLCMAKHIQALGEATSKAHDSEVSHTATMQPQKPQMARQQVHEETADATMTNSEHTEPVVPADSSCNPPDMPPEDGARHRAGEGVEEVGIGAGGDEDVDHTQATPEGTNEDQQNTNAPSALHMEPHQSSTNAAP